MTVAGPVADRLALGATLVFLALLAVASLFAGNGELRPADVLAGGEARDLLLQSRLPRTAAAILTGAGLAVAGLAMQALARNRFVDPATAGTAQSAMLGILVATLFLPAAPLALKLGFASLFALGGTAVFLFVAHRLPPEQPLLVPLFGLVYGGVIGAAATFVAWETDLIPYLDVWAGGDLSGVVEGRYELLWLIVPAVGLAWRIADRLTILSLGRGIATNLGLDYRAVARTALLVVCTIAALTVAVVGTLPFVGLVVPALVTRRHGDHLRQALPHVALGGAILLLASDLAARLVVFPYEVPAGTVVGLVGAGLFLLLVMRPRDAG